MKKHKKKEKDALIKINGQLYEIVKEFLKTRNLEYPSIKNFVENAVMRAVGFKKYDIDGVDADNRLKETMEDVIGNASGGYAPCMICNKVFFKKEIGAERICEKCGAIITHLARDMSRRELRRKTEFNNIPK